MVTTSPPPKLLGHLGLFRLSLCKTNAHPRKANGTLRLRTRDTHRAYTEFRTYTIMLSSRRGGGGGLWVSYRFRLVPCMNKVVLEPVKIRLIKLLTGIRLVTPHRQIEHYFACHFIFCAYIWRRSVRIVGPGLHRDQAPHSIYSGFSVPLRDRVQADG